MEDSGQADPAGQSIGVPDEQKYEAGQGTQGDGGTPNTLLPPEFVHAGQGAFAWSRGHVKFQVS